MRPIIAAFAVGFALSACATASDAIWTTDRWLRQSDRDVTSDRWAFSAAPMGGDGFQLRLTLKTDDLFRPSTASERPDLDVLTEAARRAAPEGCEFASLDVQPDGSAVADYECE